MFKYIFRHMKFYFLSVSHTLLPKPKWRTGWILSSLKPAFMKEGCWEGYGVVVDVVDIDPNVPVRRHHLNIQGDSFNWPPLKITS